MLFGSANRKCGLHAGDILFVGMLLSLSLCFVLVPVDDDDDMAAAFVIAAVDVDTSFLIVVGDDDDDDDDEVAVSLMSINRGSVRFIQHNAINPSTNAEADRTVSQ